MKMMSNRILSIISVLLLACFCFPAQAQLDGTRPLIVGWSQVPPFSAHAPHLDAGVDGLDIRFIEQLMKDLSQELVFHHVPPSQLHEALESGSIDIALNVIGSEKIQEVAHLSSPYRIETDIAVYYDGTPLSRLMAREEDDVLAVLQRVITPSIRPPAQRQEPEESVEKVLSNLRIGVNAVHGYDTEVEPFLAKLDPLGRITRGEGAVPLANLLNENKIDVAFMDAKSHETLVRADFYEQSDSLETAPLLQMLIYVAFSRETIDKELVDQVNQRIDEASGVFDSRAIFAQVVDPWLISQTLMSRWFFWADIIGTIAFALSGVIIARRERYSLFGAFVLAALPAVGGGVLRDILVDRDPIGILGTPIYLILIIGTVILSKLVMDMNVILRRRTRFGSWAVQHRLAGRIRILGESALEITDAVGLAAFTVTGVSIAFSYQAYPLWLWAPLLAVLTSSGGGVLRDALRSKRRIPTLTITFYAEISAIFGLLMTLILLYLPNITLARINLVIVTTMLSVFAIRMLIVQLRVSPPRY